MNSEDFKKIFPIIFTFCPPPHSKGPTILYLVLNNLVGYVLFHLELVLNSYFGFHLIKVIAILVALVIVITKSCESVIYFTVL